MGVLSYSAAGTAMIRGPQYKLDIEKLGPGAMMATDDRSAPSEAEAVAEAKTPWAQSLREEMLKSMGLLPEDLAKMKPQTRADLEQHLANYVHEQILNAPDAPQGSLIDMQA